MNEWGVSQLAIGTMRGCIGDTVRTLYNAPAFHEMVKKGRQRKLDP